MKSTHFLNEAIETQAQRAADHNYGEQGERTAAHVARIFNAITGRNLKERDILAMLLALKLARNEAAPGGEDTLIDLVSYASLLAECDYAAGVKRQEDAEKENQQNNDRSQLQSLGDKLVADLAAQLVKPDSWIEWRGDCIPVDPSVVVDVKTRYGDIIEKQNAGFHEWNWKHLPGQSSADIVAFRVCPPAPKPLTASAYQAQHDDGWKGWDGSHADGPITMAEKVCVKLRGGVVRSGVNKSDIVWLNHGAHYDVIAWKPSK